MDKVTTETKWQPTKANMILDSIVHITESNPENIKDKRISDTMASSTKR